jgi:ligand-binding sensor domain-containing protein
MKLLTNWLVCLVCLLAACLTIESSAQQFHEYRNFKKTGLIHDMDLNGDVAWIAAQQGLFQFDGYRFHKVSSQIGHTQSVYFKDSLIYFHDFKVGLGTFNLFTQQIDTIARINYSDSSSDNDHYDNLFVDSKGRIWCSDFKNIKAFSRTGEILFSHLFNPNGKSGMSVSFFERKDGGIVFCNEGAVHLFKNNAIRYYEPIPVSFSNRANYYLHDHYLIGLIEGECTIYDLDSEKNITSIPLSIYEPIDHLFFDEFRQALTIQTRSEIIEYSLITHERNTRFSFTTYKPAGSWKLSKDNSFFVGTDLGLLLLRDSSPALNIVWKKFSLNLNEVHTVLRIANGDTWAASNNGLVRVSANNELLGFEKYDEKINTIFQNSTTNRIIVLTDRGCFELMDFTLHKRISGHFKSGTVDQNGQYWLINSENQVETFDANFVKNNKALEGQNKEYWSENLWHDIDVSKNGTIWLAGYMPKGYGIGYYSTKDRKFSEVSKSFGNSSSDFIGDYYNRIYSCENGDMLFAGYGGFNRLNSEKRVIQKVETENFQLPSNHINEIVESSEGLVWLGSGQGLYCYDTSNNSMHVFDELDGFWSSNFLNALSFSNGNILVGGNNGIIEFDPIRLNTPAFTEKVICSAYSLNEKTYTHSISSLVLNSGENLTLFFSNKEFSIGEYSFSFRINESEWSDYVEFPEYVMNSISPGQYQIDIRVRDNHGFEKEYNDVVLVIVSPKFFESKWFFVLIVLFAIAATWFVIFLIQKRKRKEQALKAQVEQTQMQLLRSQMNPHFIFNSLSSINMYILENRSQEASEFLTTFSKLVRSILESSKLDKILLSKEIATLEWYLNLEQVRLEGAFEYDVIVDDELDVDGIYVPPLIIQPFVENAIWHGIRRDRRDGKIHVIVSQRDEDFVRIVVLDNGIGRTEALKQNTNKSSIQKSFGVEITRNRLTMHHKKCALSIADIASENGEVQGTRVTIDIYIGND